MGPKIFSNSSKTMKIKELQHLKKCFGSLGGITGTVQPKIKKKELEIYKNFNKGGGINESFIKNRGRTRFKIYKNKCYLVD